jgi:2-aminoadipate transaminase
VTRLTIHSAYAELQAGGWIEATVGRGTFVAEQIEQLISLPLAELGRESTPAGVMNDMLRMSQLPGLAGLARADPAPDFFPLRNWQRASELALTAGGVGMMNYASPQGDLNLRSILAETVRERGISAGPDELLIVAGVTNGMALATMLLARPGATVLVEQPTYLGLLHILAAHGVRALGLPMDEDGLIIEAVEQALEEERPAFLYTIPTFQNPSGSCLSGQRRAALLELAARRHLPIVEDDIYGLLSYEGAAPRALKANDHRGQVIYLSSFSKSLMPGLRMGYMVARPELIREFMLLRQAQDICSPLLTQRALAIFIEQGWWQSHLRRMLPHYRERRDSLLQALDRHCPSSVSWTRPHGGFSCWLSLPPNIPVMDLYLSAISRGVAFTPGQVFSAGGLAQQQLRLCFSSETPARLNEAVATLGSLIRERSVERIAASPAICEYVPVV